MNLKQNPDFNEDKGILKKSESPSVRVLSDVSCDEGLSGFCCEFLVPLGLLGETKCVNCGV